MLEPMNHTPPVVIAARRLGRPLCFKRAAGAIEAQAIGRLPRSRKIHALVDFCRRSIVIEVIQPGSAIFALRVVNTIRTSPNRRAYYTSTDSVDFL